MGNNRPSDILVGNKLLEGILTSTGMTLHEFIVECLSDGALFTNQWAFLWEPKEGAWTDAMEKQFMEETARCKEDRLAIAWEKGILVCHVDEDGDASSCEDCEAHTLTLADLDVGLAKLLSEAPSSVGDWLTDNFDGETADNTLQCAVMGEIVFG